MMERFQDSEGYDWSDYSFKIGVGNMNNDAHSKLLSNSNSETAVASLNSAASCEIFRKYDVEIGGFIEVGSKDPSKLDENVEAQMYHDESFSEFSSNVFVFSFWES
eukprot:TRINITY_DN4933_c0_g1_i1.p1 TRINITY_DN4933_c0_g1~~TRINITY_DN4933_c0_g1_i1.p1  ORF type:complete len:106 (+),score=16.10 TRINITY_DN4933_c0_g1_i1:403-720(+)